MIVDFFEKQLNLPTPFTSGVPPGAFIILREPIPSIHTGDSTTVLDILDKYSFLRISLLTDVSYLIESTINKPGLGSKGLYWIKYFNSVIFLQREVV